MGGELGQRFWSGTESEGLILVLGTKWVLEQGSMPHYAYDLDKGLKGQGTCRSCLGQEVEQTFLVDRMMYSIGWSQQEACCNRVTMSNYSPSYCGLNFVK